VDVLDAVGELELSAFYSAFYSADRTDVMAARPMTRRRWWRC
jgi:hypothetical protein